MHTKRHEKAFSYKSRLFWFANYMEWLFLFAKPAVLLANSVIACLFSRKTALICRKQPFHVYSYIHASKTACRGKRQSFHVNYKQNSL
jgi:hypothetical protein